MEFNKSQKIIIRTIAGLMLGFPDIDKVFTKEIIKLAMENPSQVMIFIVSILKLFLVVASIIWLYQLLNNILITYNTKSQDVFWNTYITKLILTGLVTFIIIYLILIITPL